MTNLHPEAVAWRLWKLKKESQWFAEDFASGLEQMKQKNLSKHRRNVVSDLKSSADQVQSTRSVIKPLRYRAVLMNVESDKARQTLENNIDACKRWAEHVITSLSDEQKKVGYVTILEQVELPVMDVHSAVVPGHFAYTNYDHPKVTVGTITAKTEEK